MAELEGRASKREVVSPSRAKVSIKLLKNLGNFENVTIKIGIEDDVRADEKIDDALNRLFDKCDDHIAKRKREIERDLG